jgi:hypothetical protein
MRDDLPRKLCSGGRVESVVADVQADDPLARIGEEGDLFTEAQSRHHLVVQCHLKGSVPFR